VSTSSNYEENIKFVGSFCTVEQFWAHYCYLARPCELPPHCDIHLFKKGIKPMWEDDTNKNGGKWMIRLKKGISSRCWENLLLAILGEQFIVGDEICGVVLSIRPTEDIISLWNRTASDPTITARISKWMIRLKKGISSRCWENLLLAILGEQFIVGDEICGVVLSIRPTEDIISLWNRTASDPTITARIRDTMTRVMSLPIKTVMEYKAHNISLKDRSSYRNTDVFVR
jgi:uncharacterized membrane protein YqaE (UPF0057 family)